MRLPGGDTIAAVATAQGPGGVGIVRLSGPDAASILAAVVGVEVGALRDRYLAHGWVRDADGERIDEVLYVLMRGPRSFTGEDVAELHGHGGAANLGRLLRVVLVAGARAAEAGEFSRRAFENGQLDLTRAEAIADVASAASERALRLAQAQLRGELGTAVEALRNEALAVLAELEASIDFPEDDLDITPAAELGARAAAVAARTGALATTFALGAALRDGITVALRGPVNAGKSSLLNALVGEERALVAPEPGTTRDYVEVTTTWAGVPVTLIDTAGERDGASEIERRGIELGRRRGAEADVELLLRPATDAAEVAAGARQIVVLSKSDLAAGGAVADGVVATSALTGEGLEALRRRVVELVTGGEAEAGDGVVVTSERQRRLLEQATVALRRAAAGLAEAVPAEVAAIDVRDAASALAAIAGEGVGEDMLDELFSRFCIGK